MGEQCFGKNISTIKNFWLYLTNSSKTCIITKGGKKCHVISWLSKNSANASSLNENFHGNIFSNMLSPVKSIILLASHLQPI